MTANFISEKAYWQMLGGKPAEIVSEEEQHYKARNKASWQEHRQTFLRKHHKKSLKQRMLEVLGPTANAAELLEWAFKVNANLEPFDPWIRNILRSAKFRVPEAHYARRLAYFTGTIQRLVEAAEGTINTAPVGLNDLRNCVGRKQAAELFNFAYDTASERGMTPEAAGVWFESACAAVIRAKYPVRYLRQVLKNEKQSIRCRAKKRK